MLDKQDKQSSYDSSECILHRIDHVLRCAFSTQAGSLQCRADGSWSDSGNVTSRCERWQALKSAITVMVHLPRQFIRLCLSGVVQESRGSNEELAFQGVMRVAMCEPSHRTSGISLWTGCTVL